MKITMDGIDDDLFQAVSERAARNNRSVENEIAELLKLGLSARADRERLVMVADAIAGMTPPGPQTDPVELLREERSR